MKRYWLFIIALWVAGPAFSQYQITIDAQLVDQVSQKPIEFANVRFLDTTIGTVTLSDGTFKLVFDEEEVGELGILQLSALGYETRQITLRQLYILLERQNKIGLQPWEEPISEVQTITAVSDPQKEVAGWQGTVFDDQGPLEGARIGQRDGLKETVSDQQGVFTLDVAEGETLAVSLLGYETKYVTAEAGMNVFLQKKVEFLDEVLLEKKLTKEEKKRKRERRLESEVFAAFTLTEEDLLPSYPNISFALRRLPHVYLNTTQDPNNPIITFRRSGGLPVIKIDNSIYVQHGLFSVPLPDIRDVVSVTAIPGFIAKFKYGPDAAGGIIIFRTKQFEENLKRAERGKVSALVEGNDFDEDLPYYNEVTREPAYLDALVQTTSFEQAQAVYTEQLKQYKGIGVPYLVHVAQYFRRWSTDYSARILQRIAISAPNNARALRTMAFELEALGKYEEAKSAYQRVALLRPQEAQSYRDLAHIYKETGEVGKAFELYKQILANTTEGVDFSGLKKPAESELRQLISHHKAKVNYADLPNDLLDAGFKNDVRVVFQWNDPTAEFEVQFVNPERKYYVWKHTLFDNKERLEQEAEQGFALEEFTVDDSTKGTWQINIKYLGENTGYRNPSFLKYTLYQNFGKPNETKEVKSIKLYRYKDKVSLDRFTI